MSISDIVNHFPYPGLFLLLILGGIGLPFPEDATLILCGFLISEDVVKPLPAVIVVYSGILIADYFLYSVGRKYGRMIIKHKRFHKIMSDEKMTQLEDKFKKWGIFIIFIGRHIVVLRSQIMLMSGVMKISPLKYLLADGISSLLTMALWCGLGYIGGNSLQIIRRDISRFEHIVILLVIIFIMLYLFIRYFRSIRGTGKK